MTSGSDTILVVEDDFTLRNALAELLEDSGYSVVCAANGLDAINIMTSGVVKPAVIILDLILPHLDGVEFRAMQRSIPSIANVPVVVVTGNPRLAAAAEQLAVSHTMSKPVDPRRLLEIIKQLVAPRFLAT